MTRSLADVVTKVCVHFCLCFMSALWYKWQTEGDTRSPCENSCSGVIVPIPEF